MPTRSRTGVAAAFAGTLWADAPARLSAASVAMRVGHRRRQQLTSRWLPRARQHRESQAPVLVRLAVELEAPLVAAGLQWLRRQVESERDREHGALLDARLR